MGKIDNDYLWLREQPRRTSRLRRTAILLMIPLVAGAAWLTTTPEPGQSTGSDTAADSADSDTDGGDTEPQLVDARLSVPGGAGDSDAESRPAGAEHTAREDTAATDDRGLDAQQAGARTIAVAPVSASDPEIASGSTPAPRVDVNVDAAGVRTQPLVASELSSETLPPSNRPPAPADAPGEGSGRWEEITIQSGDTLSIAFNRHGLAYRDSLKIAHMDEYGDRFTRGLKAGDTMQVRADRDGSVLAVDFPLDPLKTLEVRPDGDGFTGDVVMSDVEHRKAYSAGTINTSFYVDALEAGLSDNQIMQLVKIFGWDIDFALDIRPGDRFVVVRDEIYRDGDKIADGPILAASFVNDDKPVRAVRYTLDNGESAYFSPEGRPMKKAFIRTPVDYTRISSRFSLSRKHPVLNKIRRHAGTDYAAPTGTPIKATGNGRIVFRGRRGGYGNVVIIRHDDHLSTRYGHMSKFAEGLGNGSRVKQGEVIGYVGMSGLATGPHLHYEFRVDGEPKDPETVDLPRATRLPKSQLADFKQYTAPLLTQLKTLSHTHVARLDEAADDASRPN
ncbi:OapA family protein [Salinisphaera orenii]|uniref:Peptidase M23 n=1 Tax=Salinisphaera orenii YIM 95161 TaxID=1051139 RepID=A0A423PDY3_9GAMM|nr:peptidoglycan DD-metalloendopeptidase family protein [Salinisphaera halophila]ROO23784.1 peptidase M23 [Salinisphaera halophila YIM 95161]